MVHRLSRVSRLKLPYTEGSGQNHGTIDKGILREKLSRKYRIKRFHMTLCFRESRH